MTVYINSTGITVDGFPLNTVSIAVETKTGRLTSAAPRGGNFVVAGRSGSIHTADKPVEEGRIVLPVWVLGADSDGNVPGGSSRLKEFYKNKDSLQRLFGKRFALLDVQATQPDGTVRRCYAECTAIVDFQMFNPDSARMNFELTIPSVYWEDVNLLTAGPHAVASSPTTVTPTGFSNGTAPIEDAKYLVRAVTGTITNPRLQDMVSGAWVQLNDSLVAGTGKAEWLVDAAIWASRTGASGLGYNTAGGTDAVGVTTKGSQVRLLRLHPEVVTGLTQVSLTYSGGGTADVGVQGKRKFHS